MQARRIGAIAATAVGALAIAAGPTLADTYPPPPITVTVTTPNSTITIQGSDWEEGTVVTIVPNDQQGATSASAEPVEAVVGEDGTFAAEVTVPADAQPGELTYRVEGTGSDGGVRTETEVLTVQPVSAAALTADPFEPDTDGSTTGGIIALGATVVAAGTALGLRRRRQHQA